MGRKTGKFLKKAKRSFSLPLIAVVIAVVLLASSAGSVLAYLSITTGETKNKFSAASEPTLTILETFDGTEKKNVSISVDAPGYAVYVRAAILVTWKNEKGIVWSVPPVLNTDYVLEMGEAIPGIGEVWTQATDKYYYYPLPVNPGDPLPELIRSCKLREGVTPPPGFDLNVEIISQTVQAPGSTDDGNTPAVTDAWGIPVGEGNRLVLP